MLFGFCPRVLQFHNALKEQLGQDCPRGCSQLDCGWPIAHLGFLCITRPLAQQPGWNLVPAPHLPCTSAITQSLLWAKRTLTLVPTKLCYSNCCNEEPEAKVQPALAGHSPPWALPSKPSFLVLRDDASKWQLPFHVAFSATSCPVQGPAVTDKGGRVTSRPPSQSASPSREAQVSFLS